VAERRVFIDSNVPMYAVGGPHALREPCQRLLQQIVAGDLAAVTDAEVHQEIYYRYLSLRLREQACLVSDHFREIVPTVLPIGLAEIRQMPALVAAYPRLQARDLIHLAVMQAHRLTRIVTADRGFDEVAGIQRLAPETF
jgi:predicted nucleic acid-binding protein